MDVPKILEGGAQLSALTFYEKPENFPIPIVIAESVPVGELWFRHPDGRVDKMVNLNRECGQGQLGGCELGLGHPGDVCLGRHPSDPRRYLVWERGTGRLLREI
jgi:hypothetical protein